MPIQPMPVCLMYVYGRRGLICNYLRFDMQDMPMQDTPAVPHTCQGHSAAMPLPFRSHALAVTPQCHSHSAAMSRPFRHHAYAMTWQLHTAACIIAYCPSSSSAVAMLYLFISSNLMPCSAFALRVRVPLLTASIVSGLNAIL